MRLHPPAGPRYPEMILRAGRYTSLDVAEPSRPALNRAPRIACGR